jgi:hypothetical protein
VLAALPFVLAELGSDARNGSLILLACVLPIAVFAGWWLLMVPYDDAASDAVEQGVAVVGSPEHRVAMITQSFDDVAVPRVRAAPPTGLSDAELERARAELRSTVRVSSLDAVERHARFGVRRPDAASAADAG